MTHLVTLVDRLSSLPLRPVPAMPVAVRAQLVAEVATLAAAVPASSAPAAVGWLSGPAAHAATGALAVVVGLAGSGVAASRALPGEPFYRVKRLAERVELAFADDVVDRAAVTLGHVDARLAEIEALLDGATLPLSAQLRSSLDALLRDVDGALDTAVRDLGAAARAGSDRAVALLASLSRRLRLPLSALAASLPGDLAQRAAGMTPVLDGADREAAAAGGGTTRAPVRPDQRPGEATPTTAPHPLTSPTATPSPDGSAQPTPTAPLPTVTRLPTVPPLPAPTDLPTLLPGPAGAAQAP